MRDLLPQPHRAVASSLGRRSVVVLTIVGFALSGISLAGCATMEVMQPTESPTTPNAPQASVPEDSDTEPVLIEVSATGFDLLGAGGELVDTFDYFQDEGQEAIDSLTELFGAEPTVTTAEAIENLRAVADNSWGGFTLRDFGSVGETPDEPAFSVVVTAEEVAGIEIETNDGIKVDSTEEEVAEVSYSDSETLFDDQAVVAYHLDENLLPEGQVTYLEDGPAAYSVQALIVGDETTVSRILAPTANFGS